MTKLFTKTIEVKTYTVEYTIWSETNRRYVERAIKFETYKDAKNYYNKMYNCLECENIRIATNWEDKKVKRFGR